MRSCLGYAKLQRAKSTVRKDAVCRRKGEMFEAAFERHYPRGCTRKFD